MPITTYLPDSARPLDEPTSSETVNELLPRLREATGCDEWYVRERRVWKPRTGFFKRLFGEHEPQKEWVLLKHVYGGEYQEMACTRTEREVCAFIFGAIAATTPNE